jgi:hypothetical protein
VGVRRLLPPRLLDGPPPSLPRPFDLLSEAWWGLPVRVRALVGVLASALAVGLLALGAGRSAYGPPVTVTVAAEDLPAGHELGPGDVTTRRWPRDLAPEGAIRAAPAGTLLGPVPRGTPIGSSMVADGGVAAMVDEGFAAVGLPASLLPAQSLGARLDLVATGPDGAARVLTHAARVLTSDEQHVWVEVRAGDAAEVASAGRAESLVAVLHAP